MGYKVEFPPLLKNGLGDMFHTVSPPTKTGESGDCGDERVTDGRIIAVEICSNVLEDHIWFALDESFTPNHGQAIYYLSEIEFLKTKDIQSLREIHKVKVAFPGSRVRQ